MLSPDYLESMPENIVDIFTRLENQIIGDIARGINENLTLSEEADYQLEMMAIMGYDLEEIKKEIGRVTDLGVAEIEEVLKSSSSLAYDNEKNIYKLGGKLLPEMTPAMSKFITATIIQSQGELRNITNTLGIATDNGYKDLSDFYRDTLDYAVYQLGSGAFTQDEVVRQAVRELKNSGIRYIDYASGRSYHLDTAVRLNINTASSQITARMSELNADMMGQDLMEITSHTGARPSHQEWQGQIVSRSGAKGYLSTDDIGYGAVDGFKGANCRHGWHPYFEGISKPAPREEEPPDIDYDGKTYTHYEATQRQRYLERRVRDTEREIIVYRESGLNEDMKSAIIKRNRIIDEYDKFSSIANLRPKKERMDII